jgi:acyl dehydratase
MELQSIFEIPSLTEQEFIGQPILIDEELITNFARLSGDINLHLEPETAKSSLFGELVAPGFLTTTLMAHRDAGIWSIMTIRQNYELIAIGIDKIVFVKPIYVNTQITYSFLLESSKVTKIKGKDGVVTVWKVITKNTIGQIVFTAQWRLCYVPYSF